MGKLNSFDRHFCSYVQKVSDGNLNVAFTILVRALGCGNGAYIIELSEKLGCPKDMLSTSRKILEQKVHAEEK